MNATSVETSTGDWRPDEQQGLDVGLTINAVLKLIFYAAVMLLGLFGNGLILRVYWSKPQKTSTHILIMGLAWTDLTVCMMRVYNLAVFISYLANKETPFVFQYVRVVSAMILFASSVLTSFIAVDRYDCVCRPNNRWLNRCRAILVILCSYGWASAVTCPLAFQIFWLPDSIALKKATLAAQLLLYIVAIVCICIFYGKIYTTVRKHVKVNALSHRHVEGSWSTAAVSSCPSRNHDTSFHAGNVFTGMPSTKVKPVEKRLRKIPTENSQNIPSTSRNSDNDGRVLEAKLPRVAEKVLNDKSMVLTEGNVHPTSSDGSPGSTTPNYAKRSGTEMSLQRKTTRMLFVTSVVFLVTWFPYWVYVAVSFAELDGADVSENTLVVLWNCTLFVYINNVVNPLIYGLANRRFRKDCQVVLRKMKIW